MLTNASRWLIRSLLALGLLAGLAVFLIYARLPVDGATGDLESFGPEGYLVQWLLEEREGGLQVGDVIVRAGGHTVDEWLNGAFGGPEWRSGGPVTYEILRAGQRLELQVLLAPVPLRSIVDRWGAQLLASLALLIVGGYVFWKRPDELEAGVLMLLCTVMAVQTWGDAYNFQYAILTDRRILWFHLTLEHTTFTITYATVCFFALVFPLPHPLTRRSPLLTTLLLYISNPLFIALAMALAPTWSQALRWGNRASWPMVLVQTAVTTAAGIRSVRTVADPVSRAQIRWILWGGTTLMTVAIPGYILPLALTGQPLLSHPAVTAAAPAFLSIVFAIPVLRYRLFDIEIVINRSLVYGTLSALLGGAYLLLVRLLILLAQAVFGRHEDRLATFVAALAIAMAFNPLREQLQRLIDRAFYRGKLDYQQLLTEMTEKLATSVAPEQLSELLNDRVPSRLQIEAATLYVLDQRGQRYVSTGSGACTEISGDHPLIKTLLSMEGPLLRLQPDRELSAVVVSWLEEHGSELIIPLQVSNALVGLYTLGSRLSGQAYDAEEVRLLHLLGQQAAVGVQNSRLFRAEQEQRRLAEALQKAADIVSSTLDLDRVLDRILEQVEQVVAGDAFNIMLLEGPTAHVVRWRGYEQLGVSQLVAGLSVEVDRYPSLAEMVRRQRPVLVADVSSDAEWVFDQDLDWVQSYVGAPIQIAGQTVGFLNVDGTRPGRFSDADAHSLEAFARHAATAIENARLYQAVSRQADELEAAVARLEELDRLKTEFIQNVSHELRTPLALIRGYAELLSSNELGELQPEQRDPVAIIARRARMLGHLVDDIILVLLADTRLQEKEAVALDELARAAYEDFRVIADQARLTLLADIAADIPPVNGETTCLRRVLDNLLSNAVKFTPAGGTIALRAYSTGQEAVLEVSDTGIGIPPDEQERIFERFYQVDGASTKRYGGVGLGLALVKEIVNAHMGSVSLRSRIDRGTTFTVAIPTLDASDKPSD
jgi:signal transduction histidine kinase